MDNKEYCESCGNKIEDFKVIDVEQEPYIICQKCYKEREELLNFTQKWMKDNNVNMKQIEKEVKLQNKQSKK